jgi:uncharacterized membrane protein YebE (DUF533 family)
MLRYVSLAWIPQKLSTPLNLSSIVRQEKNEEAIFDAAIEFESRDERDAYLAEACGGDKKLRSDVEEGIEKHPFFYKQSPIQRVD